MELLKVTEKHHCAYERADDVKVAQLWCSLLEMKKEMNEVKQILGKVSEPFKSIVSMGEEAKRKEIERLVSDIIKPVDQASQEATTKLVESLMKF